MKKCTKMFLNGATVEECLALAPYGAEDLYDIEMSYSEAGWDAILTPSANPKGWDKIPSEAEICSAEEDYLSSERMFWCYNE